MLNLKSEWDARLDQLWSAANRQRGDALGRLFYAVRILICTAREIAAGELTLRAMSLVYTTLLSLVPLLALAFSILKGLGVHNRIEPMLLAVLEPLGPAANSLTETVISFVDNVKIGVLGSIGVALLFYTVLGMLQKVESSFNFIWKIPRQRPLTQKITEYLVVLLLGPLALTLALGTTASLSSNQLVSSLLSYDIIGMPVYWLGRLVPYFMIVGIFSFLFIFVPNTRVRLFPAFCGGLISGLLWQSAAWGFANFVASSGNYNAVYSSFAIVILLLIWIYLAWIILLIGCQIAFFVQHPEYLTRHRRHQQIGGTERDLLILNLISIVQERFTSARPALRPNELARLSDAPPDLVNPMIDQLVNRNLLAETQSGSLLPSKDLGEISLRRLLQDMNRGADEPTLAPARHPQINKLGQELAAARNAVLGEATLNELLRVGSVSDEESGEEKTAQG